MRRILGLFGLTVTLALSIYVFEWQHVWEFNADRVQLLRLVFYGCAIAAVVAILVGKLDWLPAAILALGFAVTALLSRASIDLRDLTLAGAFVLAALVCSALVRPPVVRTRT